jgi:hypothetical protein
MSDIPLDDRVKIHALYSEARQQVNGYYERLALLDGATASLVVTASLGKFLGALQHKYTLGVALTSLVLAMLVLLYRNWLFTRVWFPEAGLTAWPSSEPKQRRKLKGVNTKLPYLERLGVGLSAIGIVLLLVEVWFVLKS